MVWQDVLRWKFAWNSNCKRAFSVYKFQRKEVWRTWDKGSWRGFRNQWLTIWSFFIYIVILLTLDDLVHVMLWHSFRLCWNLENEWNFQSNWNVKDFCILNCTRFKVEFHRIKTFQRTNWRVQDVTFWEDTRIWSTEHRTPWRDDRLDDYDRRFFNRSKQNVLLENDMLMIDSHFGWYFISDDIWNLRWPNLKASFHEMTITHFALGQHCKKWCTWKRCV